MLPDLGQVRVDSSSSETGGRPVNSGIPSPAISGKMVEVQLVHQVVQEQFVPELSAQLQQDVAAGSRLEFGDLRVEARTARDAGGVLPRC
jgi:hypothetical protein